MNNIDLLEQIAYRGPLFDSRSIIVDVTARYAQALAWCEHKLGWAESNDALWKTLNAIPSNDRSFLLRCAGIRADIDSICSEFFPAGEGKKSASEAYDHLRLPFSLYQTYRNASREEFELDDWREIGCDFARVVLLPLPFSISAWAGVEFHSRKWSEAQAISDLFNEHMRDTVGVEPCVIRSMPDSTIERIERVLNLYEDLHPSVINDVVLNVRHLCMIDFERWGSMDETDYREIGQSVSSHMIPSTCFFSYHSLNSDESLAEAIYHEALHKKLSNTIITKRILVKDFDAEVGPKFISSWNRDTSWNPNRWGFDRALYAYHVYAHLIPFYGAILERKDVFRLDTDLCFQRRLISLKRATEIGQWLHGHQDRCLGADGRELLRKLDGVVKSATNLTLH